MFDFDTVIRGGMIVDGSRVPRYRADLGISDGKIVKIGNLKNATAKTVLDADGLIVAPGAIDLHTHYDAQLHWDPYCTIDGMHGVTSVTIGNCGFGFAPVRAQDAERSMLAMTRNEAIPMEPMRQSMAFDWETFPQWMDHLERLPLGVNVSTLVPVSPLVVYVMGGFDNAKSRLPDEAEMTQIRDLLNEAMDVGAMGWSAQRLPPGGVASFQRDFDGSPMVSDILPDAFYLEMAHALGERDRGIMQFTQVSIRCDDPEGAAQTDLDFTARLARESGRPLLYNSVAVNDEFPEMFRGQLAWLEKINAEGVRVFGQASSVRISLTFALEDWNLFDQSDHWREATTGSYDDKKRKLADPGLRKAMKAEYDSGQFTEGRPYFPFEIELKLYRATKIRDPGLKRFEGQTLAEIAAALGKHPIDAMLDISLVDGLKTEWRTPMLNVRADYAREVMTSPYSIAGLSDGGAHTKFLTAGVWPTDLITWMVRETGALSLEEAHYRLSGLPAWASGIKDRGLIREGQAADLIIYDLDKLAIGPWETRRDQPCGEWRRVQSAIGYRWIVVNGQVTFADGECTGATPGRLLRNGEARAT